MFWSQYELLMRNLVLHFQCITSYFQLWKFNIYIINYNIICNFYWFCQNMNLNAYKKVVPLIFFKYWVTLDFNLKWSEHIHNIKNKMRSLTVLFYKIWFLDKSNIRQIYMALCDSILLYGITCWGGTNKTDISALHITQKMIVKV